MSTHVPGFQLFSAFLHHFVLAKLATRSIRVKVTYPIENQHLDLIYSRKYLGIHIAPKRRLDSGIH